jgi:thiol-disulfide isomerase/thioredoxin
VRKINALFLTLLFLNFTGCEDKKSDNNALPVENTTEIFGSKNKNRQIDKRFKVERKEQEIPEKSTNPLSLSDTFKLNDIKNTNYTVTVSNQKVTFKESSKAITLIRFFASWCPPCAGGIPYMNDLYLKNKKDVLLTGILIHDTINKSELKSFISKHEIKYFISNSTHNNDFASLIAKTLHLSNNFSIPLTVMYVEGKYFTHYEGSVPIEMIEYDIAQARKTLK